MLKSLWQMEKLLVINKQQDHFEVKNINLFNPFPHTTILQQTTLNVFCQNIENLHNWMDNLWQKMKNIVAKGEIACFVTVFKKLSAAEASESVYIRETVKWLNSVEIIATNGKIAHYEQFLLLPQWFQKASENICM